MCCFWCLCVMFPTLLPVSIAFTGLDKPHLKFIMCTEVLFVYLKGGKCDGETSRLTLFLSLCLTVVKALVINRRQRHHELKGQKKTKKKQMLSVCHYFNARIFVVILWGQTIWCLCKTDMYPLMYVFVQKPLKGKHFWIRE